MCPCVLIDKLKNALGKKKKKKSKETSVSGKSGTPEEKSALKKEKSRKSSKRSKRSEKSKKGKKKEKSEDDKSNTKTPDASSGKEGEKTEPKSGKKFAAAIPAGVELLGQVFHKKPEPKGYLKRVLQTERPDLVGPDTTLTDEELIQLDIVLLKNGEMRGGIDLTMGEIVDCESTDAIGDGSEVTVILLYASGRFGSVYLVHRQNNTIQRALGIPNGMALKTSRRTYSTTRIYHEIATLLRLFDTKDGKLKRISHVVPMVFHGTSCGNPYIIMPMMDISLEKLKQEFGKVPWAEAFYIGQEALIGIRECHERSILHRDIKPTNLLLGVGSSDEKTWWLCDFGDSCSIGETKILSPPDALTLPYLSRMAHEATQKPIKSTILMDIESWLYLFIDLFIVLPWKNLVEEEETLNAKNAFWASPDGFFEKNSSSLPPQLLEIIKIIGDTSNEKPYTQLVKLLRDGFDKNMKTTIGKWIPHWIEKRPRTKQNMFNIKESTGTESAQKTSDSKSVGK